MGVRGEPFVADLSSGAAAAAGGAASAAPATSGAGGLSLPAGLAVFYADVLQKRKDAYLYHFLLLQVESERAKERKRERERESAYQDAQSFEVYMR